MDYEVFILTRMREEYDHSRSTEAAVVAGIGRTGRLVTSAASGGSPSRWPASCGYPHHSWTCGDQACRRLRTSLSCHVRHTRSVTGVRSPAKERDQ